MLAVTDSYGWAGYADLDAGSAVVALFRHATPVTSIVPRPLSWCATPTKRKPEPENGASPRICCRSSPATSRSFSGVIPVAARYRYGIPICPLANSGCKASPACMHAHRVIRWWMTACDGPVMPTVRLCATSARICSAAVYVFPVPGGPCTTGTNTRSTEANRTVAPVSPPSASGSLINSEELSLHRKKYRHQAGLSSRRCQSSRSASRTRARCSSVRADVVMGRSREAAVSAVGG